MRPDPRVARIRNRSHYSGWRQPWFQASQIFKTVQRGFCGQVRTLLTVGDVAASFTYPQDVLQAL